MTILLLSDYVAGTPHRVKDGSLTDPFRLAAGDEMTLVPDPNNPFDPNAIKVIHKSTEQDCGFVPAVATPVLHAAFARGDDLEVRILDVNFTDSKRKWKEIIIQVEATLAE